MSMGLPILWARETTAQSASSVRCGKSANETVQRRICRGAGLRSPVSVPRDTRLLTSLVGRRLALPHIS